MIARLRTYAFATSSIDNVFETTWSDAIPILGPGDLRPYGEQSVLILRNRDLSDRDAASWAQAFGLYVLRGGQIRWRS